MPAFSFYEMDPVPLEAPNLFKYELLLRQKRNVTYDRLISLMARKQNIWMKKKTFEWKRKLIPAPVCSANVYFQNSVPRCVSLPRAITSSSLQEKLAQICIIFFCSEEKEKEKSNPYGDSLKILLPGTVKCICSVRGNLKKDMFS